jgi:tetratricopeptide (TPR) repeat protein
MLTKALTVFAAVLIGAESAQGTLPIEIRYGVGRNRTAMKLWKDAEEQLKGGDVDGARRNVEAALGSDPTLWPALYTRAKIFIAQHQYELAVRDCSEALRQYPPFIEAALLRANANAYLGRYAEALKEINHCISIHPRSDALGRALSDRAWLEATCPDPAFRNGQQAIKDATKACKLLRWQDEYAIEALALAYAEVGDFDSAVRHAEEALTTKGISAGAAKVFQRDVALFKQHQSVRLSR